MSGIAAVYNLDGRPVDRGLLSRMINAVQYRGPDGIHAWTDGPVGLAHAMMCTTPESLRELQPLRDDEAGLVLTMDGRVDNRDDLAAQLTSKGYRLRGDTDAELVLRAYECWNDESPGKIIGDFAYVVWDARRRQLFCARDPIGVRPLYYFVNHRTFLCASEVQQLFRSAEVPRVPNERMVGEHLSDHIKSSGETLFRDVLRLAHSHSLTVSPNGSHGRTYFDLRSAPQIRYKTDSDYAEHFRESMTDAVRCRLRSNLPIGSELSGGLDSSSIVGAAQALMRNEHALRNKFKVFSLVYSEPEADERSYIDEVVRMWRLDASSCGPYTPDWQQCWDQSLQSMGIPDYPNGTQFGDLWRIERQQGFRVILSGLGGDERVGGSPYGFADMICEFRLRDLMRELRRLARRHRLDSNGYTDSAVYMLTRFGIAPLLARSMSREAHFHLRRLFGVRPVVPAYIDREFARRIDLPQILYEMPGDSACASLAQQQMCAVFLLGGISYGQEFTNRAMSQLGLEQRSPFYDRRLIEFCFGIPEQQRSRDGVSKFVLRNGMKELLPTGVLERQSKGEFTNTYVKALAKVGGEAAFHALSIDGLGWIVKDEAVRMYREMIARHRRDDFGYIFLAMRLWCVFAIDIWFKTCIQNKNMLVTNESRDSGLHAQ